MAAYSLMILSRWFNWRDALVVGPRTLTRWHRAGFRLFWRYKSRPGRPPIPRELQTLIRQMALENVSWGEERIANELLLKLGLHVSPRTVRKYMPRRRLRTVFVWSRGRFWAGFTTSTISCRTPCDDDLSICGPQGKMWRSSITIEVSTL